MQKNVTKMRFSSICKFNELVEYIEKNEKVKVFKLNIGQPDIRTDKSYYNGLKTYKNSKKVNSYSDSKGNKELRNEFAKYYNEKIKKNKFDENNVQITLGASDAIINLLELICDENDSIILIEPFFSDYKIYCDMLGINIIPLTIKDIIENNVHIKDNCKAILFSNPSNPDGYIYSENDLRILINIAQKNNLYVISDEVYSEIIYEKFMSLAVCDYDKTIIVDSVSKKFNNCGARIGAIITQNQYILNNVLKIYDARISISNVEQFAVIQMFKSKSKIFKRNLKTYTKRKNDVEKFLKKQSLIKYTIPKGGIFFFLELPIDNSTKFTQWLLSDFRKDNKTVYILPAQDFYYNNNVNNKIRLTIANSSKYTIKAMQLLIEAVTEYRKVNNDE